MIEYRICLGLSLFVLLVSVVGAARYGKGVAGWARILGIGVVLAIIILLLPSEDNIALSILGGLQVGSLDASYKDLLEQLCKKMSLSAGDILLCRIYSNLITVLFVLSPLLLGGIILSFFTGVSQQCKYYFRAPFCNVYYFSELNEHAMTLAGSICERGPCLIVFCNTLANNRLYDEARKRGYVLFASGACEMKHYGRRECHFFEIAQDMTGNLSGAQRLIMRFSQEKDKDRINIFLFSNQDDAEILLDATNKHGLSVTVINEPVTVAYNLLYDLPLFRALEATGDDVLSVMVIGAGKIGLEIVKGAAWCGQMDGIPLEITVIDRDAGFIERKFRMECPELMNGEYDIRFLNADVRTDHFEEVLNSINRRVNYIAICMGWDELNIRTALYLRGYYLRKSPDFLREPVICTQVASEARRRNLLKLTAVDRKRLIERGWEITSPKAQNYNIQAFGTYESIYSYRAIVHSPVESLAISVNAMYERTRQTDTEAAKTLYIRNVSEVNKRSSRATAVHIPYKLHSLGFEMIPEDNPNADDLAASAQALKELRKRLNDKAVLSRLAEMEHYRWNAFQRSEGYRKATIEEVEIFRAHTGGSHIHRRAKLHACLCSWEELHRIAEKYNKESILYDIDLIRNLPEIIGAGEDSTSNLGGTIYLLRARRNAHETDQLPRVLP